MKTLQLNTQEQIAINQLLEQVETEYLTNYSNFVKNASITALELPYKLRQFIHTFKSYIDDEERVCLISNLPVNSAAITPLATKCINSVSATYKEEAMLLLLGATLGEVFGWKNEQEGCLVHDIIPVPEHKNKQISTGAYQDIHWHTEEAFHDYPSDYLGLLCIKNNQAVPTTYCSINSIDFGEAKFDILFEKKYYFQQVESHQNLLEQGDYKERYIKPVLFGDRKKPFIQIDYYFMDDMSNDIEAKNALKILVSMINNLLKRVVLKPGDLLLIDNKQCVHGRDSFKPNYDGQDRWIKRINITRDIYKSRNFKNALMSRILI